MTASTPCGSIIPIITAILRQRRNKTGIPPGNPVGFWLFGDKTRKNADCEIDFDALNSLDTQKAREELQIYTEALRRIVDEAIEAFVNNDRRMARLVEPLEEVIDGLNKELKERHIRRLREGKCTIELGFVLSDITTNCERIADHCSNVAVSVLQVKHTELESHEYLDKLRVDDPDFKLHYNDFVRIYRLP